MSTSSGTHGARTALLLTALAALVAVVVRKATADKGGSVEPTDADL